MSTAKILAVILAFLILAPQSFAQLADDYGINTFESVGNYCPELSITIVRGNRDLSANPQVTNLQKFLSAYYDIPSEELVTGFFGRITQDYVIKFQKEQGLPSLGIVGSMTRASIAKACGGTASVNQSSNTNQSVTLNLPVGCTSTTNFSPVTGQRCGASANTSTNVGVDTNQSTRSGIFTTSSSLFSSTNATASNQSATISSIVSNSRTPVITGTATGVSQIGLSLGDAGGKVYGSGNGTISVIDNRWSHTVNTPLADGSYTIDIVNTNSQKLASGFITVKVNGVVNSAVSATIDNNSGSSITPEGKEGITIFGTAAGISAVGIIIRDQNGKKVYTNPSVSIVNGQYKKVIYNTELNLVPGDYKVFVYDMTNLFYSSGLLAEKVITISGATSATYSYINASAGTGGTISPSGSVVMSSTGTQTFTATPNSGYAISSFVVDGVNKGAISSYTFSNVTSNHTISVSFSQTATRTISVVVSSGGSVSPSGSVSVVNGGSQSFTATANAGYKALVQVDGVTIYENVPYNTGTGIFFIPAGSSTGTFSNVTGNHTIRVSFSAN